MFVITINYSQGMNKPAVVTPKCEKMIFPNRLVSNKKIVLNLHKKINL